MGRQVPLPRQAPTREIFMAKLSHPDACTGLSARPLHPFGPSKEKLERPIGLQAQLPHQSRRIIPPSGGKSRHNSHARCKQYLFGCLITCQGVTIGEFPKYLSPANNQRSKDKTRSRQYFICCAPCSSILLHPAGIPLFSPTWTKENPIPSPARNVSSARLTRAFFFRI